MTNPRPKTKRPQTPAGKPAKPGTRFALPSIDRALLFILIASALLRLWGIGDRLPDASLGINVIDDTAIEETDRTTIMRSWGMWRGGLRDFDLNPHTGGWPALSFYITLGVQLVYKSWYGFVHSGATTAEFAEHVQRDSAALFLLARLLNAAIGVLSVLLTWRLALSLVGRAAAILAALFLAANPLHILTSQHISDPNLLALVFGALLWAPFHYDDAMFILNEPTVTGPWPGLRALLSGYAAGEGDGPLLALYHWILFQLAGDAPLER